MRRKRERIERAEQRFRSLPEIDAELALAPERLHERLRQVWDRIPMDEPQDGHNHLYLEPGSAPIEGCPGCLRNPPQTHRQAAAELRRIRREAAPSVVRYWDEALRETGSSLDAEIAEHDREALRQERELEL